MDPFAVTTCVYFCLYLSSNIIIAHGIPVPEIEDELQKIRIVRSIHAINDRLCPLGTSSDLCFQKHLQLYFKMQGGVMDPVSQRNIGKRSFPEPGSRDFGEDVGWSRVPSNGRNSADDIDLQESLDQMQSYLNEVAYDNRGSYVLSNEKEFDTINNDILDQLRRNDKNTIPEEWFDLEEDNTNEPVIDFILKSIDRKQAVNSEHVSRNSKTKRDIERLQKRQLVCPDHMPSSTCFNKALSYYVTLFNTVHRRNASG
ncbi:uncharacterized protein LOC128233043 [Mya arenaria]|uniref:uncharacterized protein LOC128233043 n=1 Tax=Mya arenaria TaxID=6604 RepID=UPI0022E64EC4|nr:uncharacterized protein LOC128233043 [Mya arenaria]